MTVTCLLCEKKNQKTELSNKLIAKNKQEEMQFIGQEMVLHLANAHKEVIEKFPLLIATINGLMVSKEFRGSEEFESEKQRMLDAVCEAIIPDEEEEEEKEEMLEGTEKQACELLDEIIEDYENACIDAGGGDIPKKFKEKVERLKELILADYEDEDGELDEEDEEFEDEDEEDED